MKQGVKRKARYGTLLRMHWQWSMILALTLFVLDIYLFRENHKLGGIALLFTVGYDLLLVGGFFYLHTKILRAVLEFAASFEQIQKKVLDELEIPAALLGPDGRILWLNERMCELTEKKANYRKNINNLFEKIDRSLLPVTDKERELRVAFKEHEFRAHITRISVNELIDESPLLQKSEESGDVFMLYLFDETQLNQLLVENRDQKPVVGLIYIDNFEEVMERTDEVHQSLLNVLLERRIGKYFGAVNGLIKKLEKDRYLLMMDRKALEQLKEDHFSILEGVKTINIGNEIAMTVSIGLGVNGSGYQENYDFSRGAMEMALGRGGDQVVVRDGEEMTFFGGKTQHSEKNTRVKSRTKAQAIRELMLSSDSVITMGHAMTDMDSFGAAVGICRAARTVGKPAYIVIGELNTNIRGWVSSFRESKEYDQGMFITHDQALEMIDETTALVVVDTNRTQLVECRELLEKTSTVVLIDHHRQATDTIDHTALSYVEPSASSSCEMVAEILQYFEENVKLTNLEADCMYAGIVIDTNNFMAKTGVRTFEAAAFLRRCGADMTRVRKALRDHFESYMAKADAVRNAEKYMDVYAISICNGEGLEDPNVTGAQAANELLNIVGVKASFVITQYDSRCFISARSIDEANVQLVMERLGGGGHLNMAGAQLRDVTPQEAVEKLKEILKSMSEEGAI